MLSGSSRAERSGFELAQQMRLRRRLLIVGGKRAAGAVCDNVEADAGDGNETTNCERENPGWRLVGGYLRQSQLSLGRNF